TVYNWFSEFQCGRTFLCDSVKVVHPHLLLSSINVNAMCEMIERDRHITYREIQASLDIDMKAIHTILHDHLSVRKLCSRWIPHEPVFEAQKQAPCQTVDFLSSKNVELMTHCPYSPDLSRNDFFLFPNIKKKMRSERFESPEATVKTFRTLISEVTASEWKKCFENWFEHMQKYINLKGEYFEKQ
ncbi:hypothetical protein G5I_07706, partial [Acromyrmex echinatior]